MRELTAAQNTAQRASSFEPSVHVQIGITTYTQAQIIYCEHIERVFGGTLVVRINNSDGDLDNSDLKGKEVEVGWGFSGAAGRQEMAHLWVYSTREISVRGKKTIELFCIDNWHKLNFLRLGIGGVMLKGTFYGDLVPGRKLKGSTSDATGIIAQVSPTKAFVFLQSVSGTFVNTESAVDDRDAANYVDITTDATGVTDVGIGNSAGWDKSHDIDEIIGDDGDAGTLLYGTGVGFTLDSSDGVIDAYKPRYLLTNILSAPTIRQVIQDLMSMTKCGFRMEANNQLHAFDLRTAPDPVDYTYELAGDHTLFENLKNLSLVVPNRLVAYCFKQTDAEMTIYSGAGADTDESDAFIVITDFLPCEVDSDAEATALAEAAIHRLKWSKQVGSVKVPMNIGQELFDYISIIDTRMGVTYNGWVGGIIRHWEPGVYEMTVELGQLDNIALIDAKEGKAYFGPNVLPEGQGRHATINFNPMPAIQPFITNLVFSATDNDDILWNNGTANTDGAVEFANGETQVISHGTLNLANTGKYYLYLIKGNTTLQNTQTFSDTVGADRGIVAIAVKNATATEKASIVSLTGDMFYVGSDGVNIAQLSAINADMGLLTAGEIRVGTGTLGSDYTGWRLWIEDNIGRMAGYNSNTVQWYSGADGKLFCGGGDVQMDNDGIKILGEKIRFYDYVDPNWVHAGTLGEVGGDIELVAWDGYDIHIRTEVGQNGRIDIDADDDVEITAGDNVELDASLNVDISAGGDINLNSPIDFNDEVQSHILPSSSIRDLGDEINYWGEIHYKSLHDEGCPAPLLTLPLQQLMAIRTISRHITMEDVINEDMGRRAKERIEKYGEGVYEERDITSFPEEVLSYPKPDAEAIALARYEKSMIRYNKGFGEKPLLKKPRPSVVLNDLVWLMLLGTQELSNKLDGIESRLVALEHK